MKPLEASTGERSTRGRGKGEPEGPGGRNPYTPMLPGSGYRPRYTPRREFETPRGINRREGKKGEEGKGTIPPKSGDPEGPGGRNPYTPMIPGSECMHRYTPRREPETLRGYARREEYEGERGPRGRGKIVNCRAP